MIRYVLWEIKRKVSATLERKRDSVPWKIDFINGFTWVSTPLSTAHLSASLIEKYAEPEHQYY
jgi:hypothetical protein